MRFLTLIGFFIHGVAFAAEPLAHQLIDTIHEYPYSIDYPHSGELMLYPIPLNSPPQIEPSNLQPYLQSLSSLPPGQIMQAELAIALDHTGSPVCRSDLKKHTKLIPPFAGIKTDASPVKIPSIFNNLPECTGAPLNTLKTLAKTAYIVKPYKHKTSWWAPYAIACGAGVLLSRILSATNSESNLALKEAKYAFFLGTASWLLTFVEKPAIYKIHETIMVKMLKLLGEIAPNRKIIAQASSKSLKHITTLGFCSALTSTTFSFIYM